MTNINFPSTGLTANVTTFTAGNRTWLWTGNYWKSVSSPSGFTGSKGESSYTYSDTPPGSPLVGDRWFDSANGLELVYTNDGSSSQWVEIAASGFVGQTGYTGSTGYVGSASTTPGYSGSWGYFGSTGYTGSSGAYAAVGYTGSWGYFGSTGYSGSIGYTGSFNQNVTYTFSGTTTIPASIFYNMIEIATVTATSVPSTLNFYPSTQSVLYYTTAASANWTVNISYSASTTLNTVLSTGQSVTVQLLATQGSTAYYNTSVQVDGTTSGVTTYWLNGAPTSGHSSSVDGYSYAVIKTGASTFTVFAAQTQFA